MIFRWTALDKKAQISAEFECGSEPQLNLLAHAQLEERSLGSQCGGHGKCGKDRVRIVDPNGIPYPQTPDFPNCFNATSDHEKTYFSEEELKEGWRLACQTFPEGAERISQNDSSSVSTQADLHWVIQCAQLKRELM